MHTGGAYTAEFRILREYVESKRLLKDTSTSRKLNTTLNS
jgi:hypothetical protein